MEQKHKDYHHMQILTKESWAHLDVFIKIFNQNRTLISAANERCWLSVQVLTQTNIETGNYWKRIMKTENWL